MVSEHELIEVEKLFGKALNIPISDLGESNKKKSTGELAEISKDMESRKINSDRFKDKLVQWRLLFFLENIQDRTLSDIASEAHHEKIYLHIKLFDFVTSIEIYDRKKPFGSPKKSKQKSAL